MTNFTPRSSHTFLYALLERNRSAAGRCLKIETSHRNLIAGELHINVGARAVQNSTDSGVYEPCMNHGSV